MSLCIATNRGSAGIAELTSTETALGILFAHMQETGFNPKLDSGIKDGSIQPQAPSALSVKVLSLGITPNGTGRSKLFEFGDSDRQKFLNDVRSVGTAGIETKLLLEFDKRTKAASSGFSTINYNPKHSSARFLHVYRPVPTCGMLSLEAGFLGLFSPPGLDLVMAGISLYYGAMDLMGVC